MLIGRFQLLTMTVIPYDNGLQLFCLYTYGQTQVSAFLFTSGDKIVSGIASLSLYKVIQSLFQSIYNGVCIQDRDTCAKATNVLLTTGEKYAGVIVDSKFTKKH